MLAGIAHAVPARISHTTTTSSEPGYLSVTIDASGIDPVSFLENIDSGYRSRIEYAIRLAPERRQLIRQTALPRFEVSYEAWFDPFRERYVIESNDGTTYTFRDASDLWSFFFRLPSFRIPWSVADADVVETRVVYRPIVFAPGLRILAVILPEARQSSPWDRQILTGAP
jgi:hypothetical protein